MNHDQAFKLASFAIVAGALAELMVAMHAWNRGLPGVAIGIALIGVVLLGTVAWGVWIRCRPKAR